MGSKRNPDLDLQQWMEDYQWRRRQPILQQITTQGEVDLNKLADYLRNLEDDIEGIFDRIRCD